MGSFPHKSDLTRLQLASNVELIWNKGIAALCDRRIPDEFPGGEYQTVPSLAGAMASSKLPDNLIADPSEYKNIKGEIIWVRVSWLKSFVKQVLPLIDGNFVLVTGDSDSCIPGESQEEAREILKSPKVLHWFTQNYDGSLAPEKISSIPIGIDFHVLAERAAWGESQSTPADQEKRLKTIAAGLPAIEDRIPKVYVDFAWQKSFGLRHYRRFHPLKGTSFHETRRKTAKQVKHNKNVFCQTGPLPRSEMWRKRGEYAFVLSPHGMGLDCHRTWEALALGHIMLVPSSSLNALYENLPVVPLRSWSEITDKNLSLWLSIQRQHCGADYPKLSSQYWINEARSHFASH
ncbi:MAG: hypothetical protein ACHP8A_15340 [Terriglobales bacterium]